MAGQNAPPFSYPKIPPRLPPPPTPSTPAPYPEKKRKHVLKSSAYD